MLLGSEAAGERAGAPKERLGLSECLGHHRRQPGRAPEGRGDRAACAGAAWPWGSRVAEQPPSRAPRPRDSFQLPSSPAPPSRGDVWFRLRVTQGD